MLLKLIKRTLLLILLLIVVLIVSIQFYSLYRANKLDLKKDHSHKHYPEMVHDVFLFSIEGSLYTELSPFYVSEYLLAIGLTSLFYDQTDRYKFMPEGSLLSYRLVRTIKEAGDIEFIDWHSDSLIVGSWVSSNYTTEEALNYYLDSIVMGVNQGQVVIGLEDASQLYFSKKVEYLNFSEIVALSVISASPARFRDCNYDAFFQERAAKLEYELREEVPQKYSKYSCNTVHFDHCQ